MRGSVGEKEEMGLREKMHEETAIIEGYLRGGENLEQWKLPETYTGNSNEVSKY